jgi:hypothetical protein
MKNLVLELVTYLNTLSYPVTVKARTAYSKAKPTYPMIVVDEIDNTTRIALKGEERFATLGYQIDIFSKDMSVGGVPTSGTVVCNNIATSIDTGVQSTYGLTRESFIALPDVQDSTISRLTLRYSGIIDVKTDYMYR